MVRLADFSLKRRIGLGELRAKFDDCVGGALAAPRRDALFERLRKLESLPETAALYGD